MKFKRLNEVVEKQDSVLMPLTTEAWLTKETKKTLSVALDKDSEVFTNYKEGIEYRETSSDWFKNQLDLWNKPESNETKVRIATPEHPLVIVVGDICLILVIEGKKYLVSSYRDIPFEGWVIPGGCPRNIGEVFNPRLIAAREAREELLIGDVKGNFFSLGSSKVELEENLQKWNLKPREIISLCPQELFLGKGDAEIFVIEMPGRKTRTENVNVIVDPDHIAVFVTLYWQINLPIKLSELRLFDGEKKGDGSLLNREVRLTNKNGETSAIFSYGQNIFSADWNSLVTKKRIPIL